MVWQKKPSSPDYVNALSRVRLLVTGTSDDWLLPWLNLLPVGDVLDVNAFCALGPPPAADFGIDDFLPAVTGGWAGPGAAVILARDKIAARAREVIFGGLCELSATGGTHLVYIGRFTSGVRAGHGYSSPTDWAIPAGVQGIRLQVVSVVGSNASVHFVGYAGGSNIANPNPGNWDFIGVGVIHESTWTAAIDHVSAYDGVDGDVVDFWWIASGTITPYVPAAAPPPPSALGLDNRVYTTIADLGAELDDIERKLHWVLDYTLNRTIDLLPPVLGPGDDVPVEEDDEDIPLAANVLGFIVYVSNVGNQTDVRFGEPQQLHNLGRVVMGDGESWLPPVEITVTPMLFLKPHPTITVCHVHVHAPATASVLTLVKKELGA